MALRDFFTLDTSIAPRLVRLLYALSLIGVCLVLVLGVTRGVRVMTRPPLTAAAMTPPGAPQVQPNGPRMMGPGMRGPRGEGPRFGRRGPGWRAFNPVLAGSFMIVRTLVAAAVLAMIFRVLSEMALAVLAMPRRDDR